MNLDPKYYICRYCNSTMNSTLRNVDIHITCNNHLPLQFDYYFDYIKEEWKFTRMMITLPNHFRFCWTKSVSRDCFWLQEWMSNDWKNNYKSNYNRFFPNEWILKQSPEKLTNLLKMYKVLS
jgi:hypothetical protein